MTLTSPHVANPLVPGPNDLNREYLAGEALRRLWVADQASHAGTIKEPFHYGGRELLGGERHEFALHMRQEAMAYAMLANRPVTPSPEQEEVRKERRLAAIAVVLMVAAFIVVAVAYGWDGAL